MELRPVEGIWKCTILGGEYNADPKTKACVARINAEIADGPDKGRRVTYEEQINNKSGPYVLNSMRAVGWKGGRPEYTFRSDVEAWIESTGGASTVEIQHLERKNGPKAGTYWAKARSIGRGPKALEAPTQESADDAWETLQRAMSEGATGNTPPPPDDDVPPPVDDSDIPF